MSTIRQWVVLGILEVLLALILMAIAPAFLNSDKPLIGFLIWVLVLGMLGGSVVYVTLMLINAAQAKKLFVSRFPEYAHLNLKHFLGLSASVVAQHLAMLEAAVEDPDFQALHISPLDLLRNLKQK